MINHKEIIWVCEEQRFVPKVGILCKGDKVYASNEIADNLVNQGLAKYAKVKKVKKEIE